MDDIKVVELFAGVGGFRLGLEAASPRFKTIWANQWEPYATEQHAFDCYIRHFGAKPEYTCKDIAVVKHSVPEHDLLVGGFPCQDYSIAKKNAKGIEGKKGVLWWEINDILQEKRPPYVLLENVDRLIRSPDKKPGRDFSIILRCFYEKGYAVEWRVINAADYGQGQRRRRTFIMAYHEKTSQYRSLSNAVEKNQQSAMLETITSTGIMAKAFPVCGHSNFHTTSVINEEKYHDLVQLSEKQRADFHNAGIMINGYIFSVDVDPIHEPPIPLRDTIVKEPVDERYFLKDEDMPRWRYAKGAKNEKRTRANGSTYFFTEGRVQFPEPLDKPSRTMLTSETEVGRSSHVVKDSSSGRLRVLLPVECERLNGFPDGWTDTGMPERMRYFCMGNALVVPIVTRIGKALLDSEMTAPIRSVSDGEAIIGTVRNKAQLDVCLEKKFYHFPVKLFKDALPEPQYVALYLPRRLSGKDAGIGYVGKVTTLRIVKRSEITEIPKQSDEIYCKLTVEEWQEYKGSYRPALNGAVTVIETDHLAL